MHNVDSPRIVLVTNRFQPSRGGIERQSGLLARALIRHGSAVTVLTDRFRADLPAVEDLDGIHVCRVMSLWTLRRPFERVVKSLFIRNTRAKEEGTLQGNAPTHRFQGQSLRQRTYRLLSYRLPMYVLCLSVFLALVRRKREYDIIQVFQTNLLALAGVLAGLVVGKPVVARDAVSGGMDELTEFLFPRWTARTIASHCNFVALSRHIEEDLHHRGIPSTRVERIPNSVELPSTVPATVGSSRAVLFVGNVAGDFRQKGLDILLMAWTRVAKEVPDCRLWIIGGGDFSSFHNVASLHRIQDSTEFLGPKEDVSEWYAKCGIFVLPSRYEGMSNALLEAMAYGKPSVVTSISGSDDLIENGTNGMKVPPEDEAELAKAIVYLLKHPEEAARMGKNARTAVESRHAPDAIAERYLSLYHRVLDAEKAK